MRELDADVDVDVDVDASSWAARTERSLGEGDRQVCETKSSGFNSVIGATLGEVACAVQATNYACYSFTVAGLSKKYVKIDCSWLTKLCLHYIVPVKRRQCKEAQQLSKRAGALLILLLKLSVQ